MKLMIRDQKNVLHQHAVVKGEFPLLSPASGEESESGREYAKGLSNRLCESGIDAAEPVFVDFGHEIACSVEGMTFTLMVGLDDLADPKGFWLILILPRESWLQRWRRRNAEPEWMQSACRWADTIHRCLMTDDRVREVIWSDDPFSWLPEATYSRPTDVAPLEPPRRHWSDRIIYWYGQMDRLLLPIVGSTLVSTVIAIFWPPFGLLTYALFGLATLWFCLKMAGLGVG
ncbi:MAG: hypothetical protein KDA52_08395 [Planctomycetaceae bacterium]|nr:hypothetical protein [Planctomycetaceae bacterium]